MIVFLILALFLRLYALRETLSEQGLENDDRMEYLHFCSPACQTNQNWDKIFMNRNNPMKIIHAPISEKKQLVSFWGKRSVQKKE